MAQFNFFSLYYFAIGLLFFAWCSNAIDLKTCKFDMLYQLGDSFSDTGNYIRENPKATFAKFPYGKSFFKKPTGRCSDGLLIVDYIAQALGLPLLPPYKDTNADTHHGSNYATAGATALQAPRLAAKNISSVTPTSLDEQLDSMFTHFNSICPKDCIDILKNSLFIVGEIGFNDYSFALQQGKTVQETNDLIPDVVFQIQDAIKTVINYGAVRIVVPGTFPLGCFPIHLTKFSTNNASAYDANKCLKDLNNLSNNHNKQLQQAIEEVKKNNTNVTIVYGDYYNYYINLLNNAQKLGFDAKSVQKTCCGIGGNYSFSSARACGAAGVPVCSQPNTYLNWDGINLTQQAYKYIAQSLINDITPKLNCGA